MIFKVNQRYDIISKGYLIYSVFVFDFFFQNWIMIIDNPYFTLKRLLISFVKIKFNLIQQYHDIFNINNIRIWCTSIKWQLFFLKLLII
jgi:hypothetical protein